MRQHYPAETRHYTEHGWLKSFFSFSFDEFRDPERMNFSHLRVLNEDRIEPMEGFPTHPHRDMEIITYMVSGELQHKDTLGNEFVIRPGEVQVMSAGTGIEHSEYNNSTQDVAHLLQIWILPREKGLTPSYQQKSFADAFTNQDLTLVVSPDGAEGSLKIHQDARIWVGQLAATKSLEPKISIKCSYWIQVISGKIKTLNESLKSGDALSIVGEETLQIECQEESRFLFFELEDRL